MLPQTPNPQEIQIQSNAVTGVLQSQGFFGTKSETLTLRSPDGKLAMNLFSKDFPFVGPGEQVLFSVTITRVGPAPAPQGVLLPGLGKEN